MPPRFPKEINASQISEGNQRPPTAGDASETSSREDIQSIFRQKIQEILTAHFSGLIDQLPPKYSALKIGGKRACDLMREGKDVELKVRRVEIFETEIVGWEWPFVDIRVACGAGTYIRSLVHDLGQKLGCGAYVKKLRRTKIGQFGVEEVSEDLMSVEDLCRRCFECRDLSDQEFISLQDGKILRCESGAKKMYLNSVVVGFYQGKVVGVLEFVDGGGGIKIGKRIFSA